ncbi:hypothetical protein BsWGS_16390 [Bradybaena similaris]
MADVHRKWIVDTWAVLTLVLFVGSSQGLVHELTKANFAKFVQGKFFLITFVGSPTCSKCKNVFPIFWAASEVFPHDPEIFFARTNDKDLVKDWGITELPTLVYQRVGMKLPEIVKADIIVDDIIDEISRILAGDFGGLTRTYTVDVNEKNFQELVVDPDNSVLLLIHGKGDENAREALEKVSRTFRADDAVLCATLDATRQKKLKDDLFRYLNTPAMLWYPPGEKQEPKQFGGMLTHELLTEFVNMRTGLHRQLNGKLGPEAGRVKEADELLEENVAHVMGGTPEEIKSVIVEIEALLGKSERQHIQMLEYYLYILENISANKDEKTVKETLEEVLERLNKKTGVTTRQKDTITRKRNIVKYFLDLEDRFSEERPQKEEGPVTEKPPKKDKSQEHKHEDLHEEL